MNGVRLDFVQDIVETAERGGHGGVTRLRLLTVGKTASETNTTKRCAGIWIAVSRLMMLHGGTNDASRVQIYIKFHSKCQSFLFWWKIIKNH